MLYAILSSVFFATTYVLNRNMELAGGHWIWSASLRFIFMLPFLILIVMWRGKLGLLIQEMKRRPWEWMLWSTVGFGVFYATLCFAAAYGPAWLIAGSFQITIVAGSLLVPFFYEEVATAKGIIRRRKKIPFQGLGMSLVILVGIALMQVENAGQLSMTDILYGLLPVIISAFAYPLGNRKMMEVCEGRLDTIERVLGMTIASLPFWMLLSLYGFVTAGGPSTSQVEQSFFVAIFSGIIATILLFKATDMVRESPRMLASVEAAQAGEVLFSLLGEILFFHAPLPSSISLLGICLVVFGVILHSYQMAKLNSTHVAEPVAQLTIDWAADRDR
nr:multidrug resistance efflux transporter family protein [Rubeoparvulum massiliense]